MNVSTPICMWIGDQAPIQNFNYFEGVHPETGEKLFFCCESHAARWVAQNRIPLTIWQVSNKQ